MKKIVFIVILFGLLLSAIVTLYAQSAQLIVDGNVGIGTTTPTSPLVVTGCAQFLSSAPSFPTSGTGVEINYDSTAGFGRIKSYDRSTPQEKDLALEAANLRFYTTGGERMRIIASSGNVGIGTTSPEEKLHIQTGDIKITERAGLSEFILHKDLDISASTSNLGYINFTAENAAGTEETYARIRADGRGISSKDGKLLFLTMKDGTLDSRLTINYEGNVGIGRDPTTYALEVEGEAAKTASGQWEHISDIRFKTDIQDITNALDTINQLRPVRFRFKETYREEHPHLKDSYYYDFTAQEYQKVFPDSVKAGKNGDLFIDAYNTTPYLVAAVQELSKTIKEIKAENKMLRRRLTKLEKRR